MGGIKVCYKEKQSLPQVRVTTKKHLFNNLTSRLSLKKIDLEENRSGVKEFEDAVKKEE